MMTYQRMFAEYNQTAGQILMTKDTILEDESRQNAHNTFEEMFRLGIIPVVNENDTVSTYEMHFGCLLYTSHYFMFPRSPEIMLRNQLMY